MNATWLLDEMLKRTGLRVLKRPGGQTSVYLLTADLENPALLELEEALWAAAPLACTRRLYSKPQSRAKSVANAILQFNNLKPELSRCQHAKRRTMRYEIGQLDLEKHAKYLKSA